YGIFIWKEGKFFQLGQRRDDFMGFSLHPSNPDVIYTSGHPKSGGKTWVMKSENGGMIFERIFLGLNGESVDFHSMIISPANPNVPYGALRVLPLTVKKKPRSTPGHPTDCSFPMILAKTGVY